MKRIICRAERERRRFRREVLKMFAAVAVFYLLILAIAMLEAK
jgi:predicted nucleic acid-binding Zn ribbon protein